MRSNEADQHPVPFVVNQYHDLVLVAAETRKWLVALEPFPKVPQGDYLKRLFASRINEVLVPGYQQVRRSRKRNRNNPTVIRIGCRPRGRAGRRTNFCMFLKERDDFPNAKRWHSELLAEDALQFVKIRHSHQ